MKYIKNIFVLLLAVWIGLNVPNMHYSYLRYKTQKSVVKVTLKGGKSGGTGVHVKGRSGKVYILTNAHVCSVKNEAGNVYIEDDFGSLIPRKVIEESDYTDLCLIEALPNNKSYINLGSSPKEGQLINAVGHPRLMPTAMTGGEVVGFDMAMVLDHIMTDPEDQCNLPKNKIIEQDSFFGKVQICTISIKSMLTTVQILPGSSGSPVINSYGNLVGLMYAGNSANWGLAVTLEDIKEFLNDY